MSKKIYLLISILIIPLASAQNLSQFRFAQDFSQFGDLEAPVSSFYFKSLVFHEDSDVNGIVSPVDVHGRVIQPYAYSYRNAKIKDTSGIDLSSSKTGPFGLARFDVAFDAALSNDQNWKEVTSAREGSYQSESILNVVGLKLLIGDLYSTPLTRRLNDAGYLAVDNGPIATSQIIARNNLTYSGKEINDIERSRGSIGAYAGVSASLDFLGLGPIDAKDIASVQKTLFDKNVVQYADTKFLYNTKLKKESNSHIGAGTYATTDSLLTPTYRILSLKSDVDYGLRSQSTGIADLSYAELQTSMASKPSGMKPSIEGGERYTGNYDISRNLHLSSQASVWNPGDFNDYDWLPCCFGGYLTMPYRYQTGNLGFGSNVKGVFDCTCYTPLKKAEFPRVYK